MTETENKPDRFYVDVTVHDYVSGARRSVNSTITEDGDLAEELLDAVVAVATAVGHRGHMLGHLEAMGKASIAAGKRDVLRALLENLPSHVVAVDVKTDRTEELDQVVALLDGADWLRGRDPRERVGQLLSILRVVREWEEKNPHEKVEVWKDAARAKRDAEDAPEPAAEPMPRSLAEPAGEDPADDGSFLGPRASRPRPVRDVHLPEPDSEPAESGV
jgi:hypothetical protein